MNSVIIKEENMEDIEFQWMPVVSEEIVSTPNGEKSQDLPKSQKGKISKNNTHIPSASCINSESGKKNIASKKKRKDKKAKDRVKRPLNAFMLYLTEKRAEFVANSTINKYTSLELTKVVGKLWQSLTDEQRAPYYAQAHEERRRHALLHPRKTPPRPRKRTYLPDGVEFTNCRAKYGMDSKNLWCANCRRKKKCLWVLMALAEANGGVLPKLLPRFNKPSKVSSKNKKDSSSTIRKMGFKFRKCRAKYGLDSKHLWCANCRKKQKCFWLLKALAEENGGVLPKLPPRRKKSSKDSSENNDSSSTISTTDINLEKCRQKDNTALENQESKPRTKRKAIPSNREYNIYVRQLKKMAQSCFDDQNKFAKFCLDMNTKEDDAKSCFELNAKEDDAKSCLEMNAKEDDAKSSFELNAKEDDAKSSFELNAKEDDAKSCLEMNATQDDAKSCFEKNVRQDTELDDNGKEIQIKFRKCRAKYGLDSKHLWCANCRRKQKCLWLQKALAEENGGVLPKLPPRRKKPSKDSSENNDSSSTISKTDIEFQWMPVVSEEIVSTPNGEKSQDLPKSQKGKSSKNNSHILSTSCIDSESGIASKKKRKDKNAKDRVKKPLNAFMLYLKEKRAEFVANSTIYKYSSELNKVVGKLWHSLTDEQRAAYYAQAWEERRRHALLHPCTEPPQPRKRKRRPDGFKFRKCRAKYGLDSKHLWCANCRRKQKCLWLLKALAEENGGVLPKLPPRRKKPSKDSIENNDSSSTISKTDINLEKCRQKDNTALENQESKPRPRRKASRADTEYNRYARQLEKMAQSCFVFDGQPEFGKFCFELNAKEDDAKPCLEMNAKQGDAKSCFEKNVRQDTELDDNGKEIQIEPYKMKNEIEDFVPHTVKLEIIEYEESKVEGIASQAAAVEMIKVENIKEERIDV